MKKPDINFTIRLLDGPTVIATGTLSVRIGHFDPIAKRSVGQSAEEAAMRAIFDLERTINTHSPLRAHIDLK